ncbi:MAG: TrkH family potassium uptake protein [Bacteroidaceae bacterium]
MLHKKLILRILGFLLCIESVLLLMCAGVSFYYTADVELKLGNVLNDFLLSAGITLTVGLLILIFTRGTKRVLNRRDGYVVVTFSWLTFSLFGMLPYYISGYIPSITDAFFETMSGFTATGASILDNIEEMPHGILFWRSMTQWIGGLGIVFFTLAVLPIFGVEGIRLFAAESTGPTINKVHPRVGVTAKWIWSIYLGLTAAEVVFLLFGGMGMFDSICHSLTTTSTGGYSTRQSSIAAFNSPYIEYVIIVFMFLSGINFNMLFMLFFKAQFKRFFGDIELRGYFFMALILVAITTIGLYMTNYAGDAEVAFRKAAFQVISIFSTTGFVTDDYMLWIPFLWTLMSFIMFMGACAGSTTGAMKTIRLITLGKIAHNEFRQIVHPNAVLPVRINKQVLTHQQKSTMLAFTFIYVLIVAVSWLAMVAMGVDFDASFGIVASSMGGVGPGLGTFGPSHSWAALPDLAKWWLAALMLIGRLEIFSVLLVFTPDLWNKR